jgi:hypothetical protein
MQIYSDLGTHLKTYLGKPPLTQTMQMIAATHSGQISSKHMTLTFQKSLGEPAKTSIKSATFSHRSYCKHEALS